MFSPTAEKDEVEVVKVQRNPSAAPRWRPEISGQKRRVWKEQLTLCLLYFSTSPFSSNNTTNIMSIILLRIEQALLAQ